MKTEEEVFIQSYLIRIFTTIILWVIMFSVSTSLIDYSKYVVSLKGLATVLFLLLSFLIVVIVSFVMNYICIYKEENQT